MREYIAFDSHRKYTLAEREETDTGRGRQERIAWWHGGTQRPPWHQAIRSWCHGGRCVPPCDSQVDSSSQRGQRLAVHREGLVRALVPGAPTGPKPVTRMRRQAPSHRVGVNITNLLVQRLHGPQVPIISAAALPEAVRDASVGLAWCHGRLRPCMRRYYPPPIPPLRPSTAGRVTRRGSRLPLARRARRASMDSCRFERHRASGLLARPACREPK